MMGKRALVWPRYETQMSFFEHGHALSGRGEPSKE